MFFVKIGLATLRARLSQVQEREVTNDDAFDWLIAKGFRVGRIGWYAPASALDLLDPSEVGTAERIL